MWAILAVDTDLWGNVMLLALEIIGSVIGGLIIGFIIAVYVVDYIIFNSRR